MFPEERKRWICQEEARLTKYQHQHRGLSFQKLRLPPSTHRKVNLMGRDNHIYRGSIVRIPEDQLPPEVDESSIDEEALYKEIRDLNFPPVPEQEPLGPSRRIGGEYTVAKRMALAPVRVDGTEGLEETLILGKVGGIYRGKGKYSSKIELDKQLRGTKRSVQEVRRTSSTRGFVEPSLVLLQVYDQPRLRGKGKKSSIELPTTELGNSMAFALIKEKNIEGVKEMDAKTQVETQAGMNEEEVQVSTGADVSEEAEVSEEVETETEASEEAEAEPELSEEAEAEPELSEEAEESLGTGQETTEESDLE